MISLYFFLLENYVAPSKKSSSIDQVLLFYDFASGYNECFGLVVCCFMSCERRREKEEEKDEESSKEKEKRRKEKEKCQDPNRKDFCHSAATN